MKITLALGIFLTSIAIGRPAETNALPRFQELRQFLEKNLPGVTPADLDRATVLGLLDQLRSQVSLVPPAGAAAGTNLLAKAAIYDDAFAYFRIESLAGDVAAKFFAAYRQLASTNKIKGVVLDLRFSEGTDYAAAVALADGFLKAEKPLLDWGAGPAKSTVKTNAILVPVSVLVNGATTGAAEALAGILRQTRVALLVGTNTAGGANAFKEFTLDGGHKLKVASGKISFADGKPFPGEGLKADIPVSVDPEEERAYLSDAFRAGSRREVASTVETSGTNRLNQGIRRRLNEAELVRMQREGRIPDDDTAAKARRDLEAGRPLITDPALVRAIDLLKGLSVVQRLRTD